MYAALLSILTVMKGLPLAYNKDMQEDKELSFDAFDTVSDCIRLFDGMLSTMRFRTDRMERSARGGFTNATDAADYLVKKGVPFRDAHGIIGEIVLFCIDGKKAIDELTIDELRGFCDKFDEDVYDAISMKTCVNTRETTGAPGKNAMEAELFACRSYIEKEKENQQS